MRYKNNFTIHNTEQLIDINKGIKNFEADISITSQNEDDKFQIVIVTQRQLDDSNFNINYKDIDHYVNVNVKSKKNEINDYVLVIRSDSKCNVEIDINLVDLNNNPKPIPKVQFEEIPKIKEFYKNDDSDDDSEIEEESEDEMVEKPIKTENPIIQKPREKPKEKEGGKFKKYFKYLKYVLIVGVALLCIYYLLFTKSTDKKKKKSPPAEITNDDSNELNNTETIIENFGGGDGDGDGNESKEGSEIGEDAPIIGKSKKKGTSRKSKRNDLKGGDSSLLEQLRKIREK